VKTKKPPKMANKREREEKGETDGTTVFKTAVALINWLVYLF